MGYVLGEVPVVGKVGRLGGPPRSQGRWGFGVFWGLGLALLLSFAPPHHRLSCAGRNPCVSGVFSLGLEQRVGYDVQITELREGRMSGPPRARTTVRDNFSTRKYS